MDAVFKPINGDVSVMALLVFINQGRRNNRMPTDGQDSSRMIAMVNYHGCRCRRDRELKREAFKKRLPSAD